MDKHYINALLTEGYTANSRFKLPLNIHENSISGFKINSKETNNIKNLHLIIWYEASVVCSNVC